MHWKSKLLRRLPRFLAAVQTEAADPADLYFAYRLLLGRKPDDEGWEHWSVHLANGMRQKDLVRAFLYSTEFRRRQRFRGFHRVELDGYSIFVDPDDYGVSAAISHDRMYEPHVTKALERELKPDSIFLDVGCHIGWFVLLAASRLPRGKVIGIEPNHNNLQLLYRSIAENRFENIVLYPCAATEKRTIFQLAYDAAYGYVHGFDDQTDDPFVQGVPIDEIVRDEARIDIIKMDIEGHEPVALRGMEKTLARHRPVILSEFHPLVMRNHAGCDAAEYFDALAGHGYSIAVLSPEAEEIPQHSSSEIMDFWKTLNERQRTDGTSCFDVIARPL